MESNDDYDSLSVFSSEFNKEQLELLNNSFSYEKKQMMNYYNIELGKEKNQLTFGAIFSNKNDKLKVDDEEDTDKEIIYKKDIQKRNFATAPTEQRRTEIIYFKIKKTELKNKYYKKKTEKERIQHLNPQKEIKTDMIILEME